MSRAINWRLYIDNNGDFELPNYIYRTNNELMKEVLDMGTLLSDDPRKLRAYKEQVKKMFKLRWMQTAEALEFFDLVVPCICSSNEYCDVCGGSRYNINQALTPDKLREISLVIGMDDDVELSDKLYNGLLKALREAEQYTETNYY